MRLVLFKLKSGLLNGLFTILCGFISRRQVVEIVWKCPKDNHGTFVPRYLGFDNITREKHKTDISKQLFFDLFSDTVILVLDGIYIYITTIRLTNSKDSTIPCYPVDLWLIQFWNTNKWIYCGSTWALLSKWPNPQ